MLIPGMCGEFCEAFLGDSADEFVGFSFGAEGVCLCFFTDCNVPTNTGFQTDNSFSGKGALATTVNIPYAVCYKKATLSTFLSKYIRIFDNMAKLCSISLIYISFILLHFVQELYSLLTASHLFVMEGVCQDSFSKDYNF